MSECYYGYECEWHICNHECLNTINKNILNGVKENRKMYEINADLRIEAQKILANTSLNDDEKLYLIFQKYSEQIQGTQLYYALLAWKDTHIKELKEVVGIAESN